MLLHSVRMVCVLRLQRLFMIKKLIEKHNLYSILHNNFIVVHYCTLEAVSPAGSAMNILVSTVLSSDAKTASNAPKYISKNSRL